MFAAGGAFVETRKRRQCQKKTFVNENEAHTALTGQWIASEVLPAVFRCDLPSFQIAVINIAAAFVA